MSCLEFEARVGLLGRDAELVDLDHLGSFLLESSESDQDHQADYYCHDDFETADQGFHGSSAPLRLVVGVVVQLFPELE